MLLAWEMFCVKLLKKEKTLVTFFKIICRCLLVATIVRHCTYSYLFLSGDVNALEPTIMTTVEPQYKKVPTRGTVKICSLQKGFVIKKVLKKIVRYIEVPQGEEPIRALANAIRVLLQKKTVTSVIVTFSTVKRSLNFTLAEEYWSVVRICRYGSHRFLRRRISVELISWRPHSSFKRVRNILHKTWN